MDSYSSSSRYSLPSS
jgi:hypothetical protein